MRDVPTAKYVSLRIEIIENFKHLQLRMKLHRGIQNLPVFRKAVVTIGSYDGVHRGHRKIISRLVNLSKENGGESVMITFEPHPRIVLFPEQSDLKLITSLDEKVSLLSETGLDHLVILPFDSSFAAQEPEVFIKDVLVKNFQPAVISIGFDHKFGKNRAGNLQLLKELAPKYSYKVSEINRQAITDVKISSSNIREYLHQGDITKANEFLGYNFTISGLVDRGDQIGRTIGFPTANLAIDSSYKLIPSSGVYAAKTFVNGIAHKSMVYIGQRPVVKGDNSVRIESHIFDFQEDIYNHEIKLEFVAFIRSDKDISNLEDLKKQLSLDEEAVKQFFETQEVVSVILNYNGLNHLKAYLDDVKVSLGKYSRLIIIDNASSDGSVDWIIENHPDLELILNPKNYGFAGGYDAALKEISAKYFVLINSDLRLTENWLSPLINTLEENSSIAAIQPKVLSLTEPDKFEYAGAAGGFLDKWAYPFCRGRIFDHTEKDVGQYDDLEEVFWATGACMVIRADLYKSIGGFDGDFFAHQEEIDLCWRLKRAGYSIYSNCESVAYHLGGGTLAYGSPFKTYLNFRNSLFMIIKNQPRYFGFIVWRLMLDGIAAFKFLMEGKIKHTWAVFKAHLSVYASIAKLIRKRRQTKILIEENRIAPENTIGRYNLSTIYRYYFKKQLRFSDIKADYEK